MQTDDHTDFRLRRRALEVPQARIAQLANTTRYVVMRFEQGKRIRLIYKVALLHALEDLERNSR